MLARWGAAAGPLLAAVMTSIGAMPVVPAPATGAAGDTVIAYDLESGDERWRRDLPANTYFHWAAIDGRRVHATEVDCGSSNGNRVVSLDGRSGREAWRSDSSADADTFQSGVGDRTVVAREMLSGVRGLDADTGEERWSLPDGETTPGEVGPFFFGGATTVLALPHVQPFDMNGPRAVPYDIDAFDRRTGRPLWTFTVTPEVGEFTFGFNVLAADKRSIVLEQSLGILDASFPILPSNVLVLDTESGEERFRVRLDNVGGNADLTRLRLLASTLVYEHETGVVGRDAETGEILWRLEGGLQTVASSKEDDAVYLVDEGADDGLAVAAVDAKSGKRRWTRASLRATVAGAGSGVFMLATRSGMVALEADTGERRWRAPYPEDVVPGFDEGYGFGAVIGFGVGSVFVNSSFDCV